MLLHGKVFELGESVEVSPDDVGFKGSWFEATIIKVHKKHKPPNHYDVEYKTLLEDDESTPLAERIRAGLIRPLPPPQRPRDFHVNDVVEAFHRDGWWVGHVTKVLEPYGNFQVTFTDLPDQIECKGDDLRLHFQWKNGTWTQPQEANQPETKEKSSEKKKVRPCKKQAGDGACKNGSCSVIQTPLFRKRKTLASSDRISMSLSKNQRRDSAGSSFDDVNQDSINIEKDVEVYKEACNNKKEKDGKSANNQQSCTISIAGSLFRSASAVNRKRDTEVSKETFYDKTVVIGDGANLHSAPSNDDSGRSPNRNIQDVTYSVIGSKSLDSETLDRAVATAIALGNGSKFINRNQKSELVEQPGVKERRKKSKNPKEEMKIVKDAAAIEGNISIIRNFGHEPKAMGQVAEVDGDGNKFLNSNHETENVPGAEANEKEIITQESEIVEQPKVIKRNHDLTINPMQEMEILEQAPTVEGNQNDFLLHEKEIEIVEQAASIEGNIPNRELDVVKEASAAEGHKNKLAIKSNQELEKNGSNPNQEMEIVVGHAAAAVNVIDSDDQNLPFVKTSPLWNIIGSMQVFQAIPQRPHFRGLAEKYPVHCLEGKAVGYMLMFRDVVQKTAESRLNDSREEIVQRLVTLSKLEKNGFQVRGIRDRLTTLLERKDEYIRIQDQLLEHNSNKTKIVQVIEELNEKIKELQEKCAKAMSKKENIEREITHLETKVVALCQSF